MDVAGLAACRADERHGHTAIAQRGNHSTDENLVVGMREDDQQRPAGHGSGLYLPHAIAGGNAILANAKRKLARTIAWSCLMMRDWLLALAVLVAGAGDAAAQASQASTPDPT